MPTDINKRTSVAKGKHGGARVGSGRKAPEGKKITVPIYLREHIKDALDRLCEQQDKSRSEIIEELIQEKRED